MGTGARGILTGLGSGAAIGSTFGPVGAAIGGGSGALLGGLASLFSDSSRRREEEEYRRKAKEAAKLDMLRSYAQSMGAPTADLDMKMRMQGIDDQIAGSREQGNDPSSFVPFVMGAAQTAGNLYKQGQSSAALDAAAPDLPQQQLQMPELGSSAGLDDDYTKKLRLTGWKPYGR